MGISEMIGILLAGYGIWFGSRGVKMYFQADKSWWRHPSRQERYPYPAAGLLLSLVFVLSGAVFLFYRVWTHARFLGYAGGVVFLLVLVVGIAQPRLFHPRWYGQLEDRLGRKQMDQLKRAAYEMPIEEWREIVASEATFSAWVDKNASSPMPHKRRGYQKKQE